MTEAEWLECADPMPMLRFLIGTNAPRVQDLDAFPGCRTSHRKLRLFACACYHRIRHLFSHPIADAAVGIAERFTDGVAPRAELQLAEAGIRQLASTLEGTWRASQGAALIALQPEHTALALASVVVWQQAPKAAYYASSSAHLDFAAITNPGAGAGDSAFGASRAAEAQAQCELVRCIVGNPFRLVAFDAEWRTTTAVALAAQVYESRDFSTMPILADALQDTGCDNDDILAHCRGPEPHVRGCWVVDLVLGKE